MNFPISEQHLIYC